MKNASIKKIEKVESNNVFSASIVRNDLIPAMIINYVDPLLAIAYIKHLTINNEDRIKAIAEREDLLYKDGILYDELGQEMNREYINILVSNDITRAIKDVETSSDVDYDLYKLNIIKDLLMGMQVTKQKSSVIPIDVLLKKLNNSDDQIESGARTR